MDSPSGAHHHAGPGTGVVVDAAAGAGGPHPERRASKSAVNAMGGAGTGTGTGSSGSSALAPGGWDGASRPDSPGSHASTTQAASPSGAEGYSLLRASELQPPPVVPLHHRLGRLQSTAIAGNDLTSSCLYTAGLCIQVAGQYAWICLLVVSGLLYSYRFIYGEVVGAMPVNGGVYNALLNTTKKKTAALAGCLSFLSYLATAVVSACSSVIYAQSLWAAIPLIPTTIAVLAVFAALFFWGVSESANFATLVFVLHISVLTILVVACGVQLAINRGGHMSVNWAASTPDVLNLEGTHAIFSGSVVRALLFGVAQGSLGITGFESSANYVEEQKPGVYPLIVRDMWMLAAFFNPAIALLALGVCSPEELVQDPNSILVVMANNTIGSWFGTVVAVDAILVLAAAVLTSYVGVGGLLKRLAMDSCLPQVLLATNKWRGTYHVIAFSFFGLCSSLFLILNGNIVELAGVYNLAFLAVMFLFTVACVLLKVKRTTMHRPQRATPWHICAAVLFACWGIAGTIVRSAAVFGWTIVYFVATMSLVLFTLRKRDLLRTLRRVVPTHLVTIQNALAKSVARTEGQPCVFFCKTPEMYVMNKGALYVLDNEMSRRITMVFVHHPASAAIDMTTFNHNLAMLNSEYPRVKMSALMLEGSFSPTSIAMTSKLLGVPPNMMFIGCPTEHFSHPLESLGGVRVVTNYIATEKCAMGVSSDRIRAMASVNNIVSVSRNERQHYESQSETFIAVVVPGMKYTALQNALVDHLMAAHGASAEDASLDGEDEPSGGITQPLAVDSDGRPVSPVLLLAQGSGGGGGGAEAASAQGADPAASCDPGLDSAP